MSEQPPIVRRRIDFESGQDYRSDFVGPIALVGIAVCMLAMFWMPVAAAALWVAMTDPHPDLPPARPLDVAFPIGVFLLCLLGFVGGIGMLLRRRWGRNLFLAFALTLMAYVGAMIGWTLHSKGLAFYQTAPTFSAMLLFSTCSFGFFALLFGFLIGSVRHLTRPEIAATFR